MRRGSRRGSRRPLEVDSLEDRRLLSQFGWPMAISMSIPPASSPVDFAFAQVLLPQVDHLREPVAARSSAGPWLQAPAQGGEIPIAYGTVQAVTETRSFPGPAQGGEF